MKPLYYYLNKYFYFPPYHLWVWIGKKWNSIGNDKGYYLHYRIFRWIGNNIGFKGMTYWERYDYLNELENQLGEIINDTPTNT